MDPGMYEWNGERVILLAPRDRGEAARALGRCTELAAAGRAVRVGVLESPYRPGARLGLDGMERVDLDSGPEAIEPGSRDGAINLLVTLRHMNRIHEVSKTDFLAVVDGGASWDALQAAIDEAGLYLPYDAAPYARAVPGGATVGEIVMGGAHASTDGRFGGLRESVLSLDMVTPAGEAIHTGSRSVKDVGGYDLAGFLLGEGGRCGIVARVTLRLLPAPKSRVTFTARGACDELRALARHVHRRMRPAFLELYVGRAAAHLVGGATGEPDGGDLLIGELQAANAGVEDRLLEEAAVGFGDGPRPVRCDPDILSNRHRFASIACDALDRGSGIVHLSCEAGAERHDSPGAIQYRSLYPERLNIFVPREEIDPPDAAACDDPPVRSRTLIDVLKSFGADRDPGLLSEVVLLYRCNGSLAYRRIHRDDLDRPAGAVLRGGSAERAPGRRDEFDILWDRVRAVFDPQGVMLP